MKYQYTELQQELRQMAKDFAIKEIAPYFKEYDVKGEFPRELFEKYHEAGYTTMMIPEEYGGQGLGCLDCVLINEMLGQYGDVGFLASAGSGELSMMPVIIGGTQDQIQRYGDVIITGGHAAFSLTEPDSGSDAASIRTTAVRDGDYYVLNGRKCFVTSGGIADIYTVLATVDRSKGTRGITCFMIERDTPGLSVGKEEDKMGLRLSNTTDLIFDNCRVPAANRVGDEGMGFKIAMKNLDRSRPVGSIGAVSIAQAAIDHALKYAKERKTFGKPLIENQAIAFMLADMQIQCEAARNLVYRCAENIDKGIYDSEFGSIVKTFCGDMVMDVTVNAVQIFGGYGYSREYPVEKLMRDAKIFAIFEGANQIQRIVISRAMMKRDLNALKD
ncbi:MAG: acyl-CoA dehydrogenase family protein [Oscillospiraceae bacterium]|nr:acyl-CoA dehydrogenase family protein [Oscillospiraceae bacterium]